MGLKQPAMGTVQGLILSGGQGRRAGGQDKGWLRWNDRPLIEIQAEWMRDQNVRFSISANRNTEKYRSLGVPVLSDLKEGYEGPLRGIEAGLAAAESDWLFVVPVDLPMLHPELLAMVLAQIERTAPLYYLASDERDHYLCQLIHRSLLSPLSEYLDSGQRRVRGFIEQVGGLRIETCLDESTFVNLNETSQYKKH